MIYGNADIHSIYTRKKMRLRMPLQKSIKTWYTMQKLTLEQVKEKLIAVREKMRHYVALGDIPINLKKAFCDAFIEKVYLFDEDPDGTNGCATMKVKIVFDAFESEGLLGFDDAEIEISSTFEPLGSP